jgi:hypothetical protein
MNLCIFTGPTLSPEEGRAELEAVYLPPVSQGDVYRATNPQPKCVAFTLEPTGYWCELMAQAREIAVDANAASGTPRDAACRETTPTDPVA